MKGIIVFISILIVLPAFGGQSDRQLVADHAEKILTSCSKIKERARNKGLKGFALEAQCLGDGISQMIVSERRVRFAANGARPYCSSSSYDPDGDGYGWENNQTCIVKRSQADTYRQKYSARRIPNLQDLTADCHSRNQRFRPLARCLRRGIMDLTF